MVCRWRSRWSMVSVVVLLLLWLLGGSRASAQPPAIVVGSKSFTEAVILGEVLNHLAQDAGADARHRAELGGTQILFQGLEQGEIDAYVDYTGTISQEILAGEGARTLDELRAALARRKIAMSAPLGFNNTYALGLKETVAARWNLRRISDLRRTEVQGLRLGFSDEFLNRADGWPGLKRAYQLPFEPRGLDHNLAYRGIDGGSLDVTDLYSTDAEIRFYHLRLLEDDLGFFPRYEAVILYRQELAERAPQVVEAWGRLAAAIDDATMVAMNSRTKLDRISESRVAADYLRERFGIIVTVHETTWLGQLARNTGQHLLLVLVSLAAAVAVAIPLGIWARQRPRAGQAILAVVGILQTIPSMAVLVFMVPLLGLGAWPAIVALFLYSLLPIVRNTYQGLASISPALREAAEVLGLQGRARLWLIELPLASPAILAGIKTAAVINVGTATIGALIGAGGFGQPILTGIRLADSNLILQGAVPAAVLALLAQAFFEWLERIVVPAGLRL